MIKEFRYALRFLGTFLGLYLMLSMVYGWWVESYDRADPATWIMTNQAGRILQIIGEPVEVKHKDNSRSVSMIRQGDVVVNVFEGCNGLNVAIVYIAFIVAFGGRSTSMFWFIPLGLFIIYLFNLGRIAGLYLVAQYLPDYFYYVHKYAFTASIYFIVFLLWLWWVEGLNKTALKKILTPGS
jgi:exosortase family protein XrtF